MKKSIIIIITLALAVSFTGCAKKQANKTTQPIVQPRTSGGGQMVAPRSLKDWLTGADGVECVVKDKEGQIITQAKGEKVLISGITYADMKTGETSEQGYSLTVGDWMYMWAGTEGTKINMAKLKEMSEDMAEEEKEVEQMTWEDTVTDWQEEEVDYKCENKRIPDGVFTVPTNVNFADLTEFMESMAEMGKKMEEDMAGEEGEIDLEALEQMAQDLEKQMEDLELPQPE